LVKPNDSEVDAAADIDSEIEQDNGIEDPANPELWDVSATPNDP